MAKTQTKKRQFSVEPWVFIPPLIAVIALVAWVVSNPEGAGAALSNLAFGTICGDFGWFFEWYVITRMLLHL